MTAFFTTGIDVIEIERIERAVERWGSRFLVRVYTEGEIRYCRGRAQRLAGRFAAKEAVSKVLGIGVRHIRWRDIEVLPDPRGKPLVSFYGRARDAAEGIGITGCDVSITHSRTDAIVVAVAWGDRAP